MSWVLEIMERSDLGEGCEHEHLRNLKNQILETQKKRFLKTEFGKQKAVKVIFKFYSASTMRKFTEAHERVISC